MWHNQETRVKEYSHVIFPGFLLLFPFFNDIMNHKRSIIFVIFMMGVHFLSSFPQFAISMSLIPLRRKIREKKSYRFLDS